MQANQKFFPLPGLEAATDRFKQLLAKSAPNNHILIRGPRGSGKSYFAQVFQKYTGKGLLTINCANLPATLLASELFGHVKGAFTGADKDKEGLIAAAKEEGKALLLEELNSIDAAGQAHLLMFMETGEYRKVGSIKAERADCRIIATMNYETDRAGNRLDLMDRFKITVDVPPLHKRRYDILDYIKSRYPDAKLSDLELLGLFAYNWPGNVRELEKIMFEWTAGIGLPKEIIGPARIGLNAIEEALFQASPSKKMVDAIRKKLFHGVIPLTVDRASRRNRDTEYITKRVQSMDGFYKPVDIKRQRTDLIIGYLQFFNILNWRHTEDNDAHLLNPDAFKIAMFYRPMDTQAHEAVDYFIEVMRHRFGASKKEDEGKAVIDDQVLDFIAGLGSYKEVERFLYAGMLRRMKTQKPLAAHWGLSTSTLNRRIAKMGLNPK